VTVADVPARPNNDAALLPFEAFRIGQDGNREKITLPPEDRPFQVKLSDRSALLLRLPATGKCRWQVSCAAGVLADEFRTRHPFYESAFDNIYTYPQGHNVLWSSVRTPFGFTAAQAEISFTTPSGTLSFSFPPEDRPAAVFLLDRVGNDHTPHLLMVKKLPDTPLAVSGDTVTFNCSRQPAARGYEGTGDPRLTAVAGGWLFDNGKIRLRIGLSGSLASWEQRGANGQWQSLLTSMQIVLNSGYTGETQPLTSENDAETFSLFQKDQTGKMTLRFYGCPRGTAFYNKLAPNTVNYSFAYTLDDSASFGFAAAVRPITEPQTESMKLALSARPADFRRLKMYRDATVIAGTKFVSVKDNRPQPLPTALRLSNDAAADIVFSGVDFSGGTPERIVLMNNELLCAWHVRSLARQDFGRWRIFSAVIGTGTGAAYPAPALDWQDRKPSPQDGPLLDTAFGYDYWGAFPDLVQMFSYALPWQMPHGSAVVDGQAVITFTGAEKQLLRQIVSTKSMRSGEKWRLSALVKGDGLVAKPGQPVAFLQFSNRYSQRDPRSQDGRFTTVEFPAGTWDYREYHVDLELPAKFDGLTVQIGGAAKAGKLWIKNVRLTRLPAQ